MTCDERYVCVTCGAPRDDGDDCAVASMRRGAMVGTLRL
jgi:hypothetical protein